MGSLPDRSSGDDATDNTGDGGGDGGYGEGYGGEGYGGGGYDHQLTNETIESMRRTRPYVLFLAVMGLLGAIVFMLGSFSTMYAGYRRGDERSPMVGMVTLTAGVLMMMFSLSLMNYGKRLTEFLRRPNAERLDMALGAQQRFWRAIGIAGGVVFVMMVVLYVVLFVQAIGVVKPGGS